MPGGEGVADAVQVERHVLRRPRLPRHVLIASVSGGQVEDAARHQRRGAVRRHVAHPRHDLSAFHRARQPQRHARPAEHLYVLRHLELEARRLRVLLALVGRQVRVVPEREEAARVEARVLRRTHDLGRALERVPDGGDVRGRPGRLADPAARQLLVDGRRRVRVADVRAELGLGHDARLLALQPVVPPAQRLLEEADGRARRQPAVRVLVRPGADDAAHLLVGEVLREPQHRVPVRVVPAADREHARLDRGVVLADAAVPPVVVAGLVVEPRVDERVDGVEALRPHVLPGVPDVLRVRRARHEREHRRRPRVHVHGEHGAAHVVHVVVVAVVRRADGHDRLQRLGARAAIWRS